MSDWQLMFVQFQTLDALQHRAWHWLGLDDSAGVSSTSVAKLHEAFHALDQSIGELTELAQRRGAGLVVVSDHGFGPFRGKISMPELLAGRGLLTRSRLARRIGHRISRAGFRARKWLSRRRRPGASTSALRRPLGMLSPIDWRTSRAVALHGDLAGLVYLNTPARFGRGPLTTPRLEEDTIAEALAALREARHPETAEPLFVDVCCVRERFGIDPLERRWPEILAIPADGYQTRTRMEGRGELILADPQLTGTHRLKGVLMLPACAQCSRCPGKRRCATWRLRCWPCSDCLAPNRCPADRSFPRRHDLRKAFQRCNCRSPLQNRPCFPAPSKCWWRLACETWAIWTEPLPGRFFFSFPMGVRYHQGRGIRPDRCGTSDFTSHGKDGAPMQTAKQLSVSLLNKPGRLHAVLAALQKEKVNILALTVMDSGERSTLRFVPDDAALAASALETINVRHDASDVLMVEVANQPGAFAKVCERLAGEHLNIDYAYSSFSPARKQKGARWRSSR